MLDFKNNRFAVIGLGKTGLSVINYLEYNSASFKIFDTRLSVNYNKYQCYLGPLQIVEFENIDIIVLSPGVSIYNSTIQQLIAMGKRIVSDIELFALEINSYPVKLIALTGSNGKTTVASLLEYISHKINLLVKVIGNIGKPVLESLLEIKKSTILPELIVLELSSFQLEATYSLKCDAATVLNISEDHMDRYNCILEYAYIKTKIFNNCKTQVLNYDDPLVRVMQRRRAQKLWFSTNTLQDFSIDDKYLNLLNIAKIDTTKLQIFGRHNYANILAACALLHAVDVDIKLPQIIDALEKFTGVSHRMQKVVTHNEITFINDSKATNVGATIAGVSGINGYVHLILGGDGKMQDFYPLRDLVENKCYSVAIIGRDKHEIKQVLDGLNIPITLCNSLADAVKNCYQFSRAKEYIILSPACSSLDMFDNYEERGKVFVKDVFKLIKNAN